MLVRTQDKQAAHRPGQRGTDREKQSNAFPDDDPIAFTEETSIKPQHDPTVFPLELDFQKTIFPGDFCMSRLNVLAPAAATGETKTIYDELTKKMGKVINIFQAMGNSSAALNAYLSMAGALAQGELAPEDLEVIYLAVSEDNGCHYCVSAHTMIAERAGMSATEILAARRFQTPDAKRQALLPFVRRAIDTKGHVSDAELAAVRAAGYTDGQIAESVAYIGLATYSNLFNHVHQTDLDFPSAPVL